MTKEQFDKLPEDAMIVLIDWRNGKVIRHIAFLRHGNWEYAVDNRYWAGCAGNYPLERIEIPTDDDFVETAKREREKYDRALDHMSHAYALSLANKIKE